LHPARILEGPIDADRDGTLAMAKDSDWLLWEKLGGAVLLIGSIWLTVVATRPKWHWALFAIGLFIGLVGFVALVVGIVGQHRTRDKATVATPPPSKAPTRRTRQLSLKKMGIHPRVLTDLAAMEMTDAEREEWIRAGAHAQAIRSAANQPIEPLALLSVPDPPLSISAAEMTTAANAINLLVGEGLVIKGEATTSAAPNPKVMATIRDYYAAPGPILTKWPRHVRALNDSVEDPFWAPESIMHRNSLLNNIRDALMHELGQ